MKDKKEKIHKTNALRQLDKNLEKETGYVRGGCSPVRMKKLYDTFFDVEAEKFDRIIVSAGKRGLQTEVETEKLIHIINGNVTELKLEEEDI